MPDVMVATRSGTLACDGQRYRLRRGRTTAHSTHPAVVDNPDLWTPMRVDLPAPDPVPVVEAEVKSPAAIEAQEKPATAKRRAPRAKANTERAADG
ncbi:hypothetical protein [Micromonospora sp. NPDC049891]|uniref:hypothetical protein n=1 Tax=Micromonospora sp. NPDC049891 TaxID=3155655 RepID=UPI0033F3D70A